MPRAHAMKGFDAAQIKNPSNEYRLHMLTHGWEDYRARIKMYAEGGVGGIATNVKWNDNYLNDDAEFDRLNEILDYAKKEGLLLWLYDEKGYPSGSADGLTLKDHPEYECRGMVCLKYEIFGRSKVSVSLPDDLEFILHAYAVDKSGNKIAADYDEKSARLEGTEGPCSLYVFARKILFEGSHAEKCGYGPRRYPNLLDKRAVAEFISNTYDKYYAKVRDMSGRVDAVFTDEPSMMAGYINTDDTFPYAALGYADDLPKIFKEMHGYDVFENAHHLFGGDSAQAKMTRLHYHMTTAKMMSDAFFKMINDWCAERNILFSGHNLLEEHIGFHVVMNGDIFSCLRQMSWPGVDILTGHPEKYKYDGFHYIMASLFVSSVARITGRAKLVMVEICPVDAPKDNDYTFAQHRGTMDLIYHAGVNHINSYISAERLGENLRAYTDYFARIAYVQKNSEWDGKIAVYYPIESAQSVYTPTYRTSGEMSDELNFIQNTMKHAIVDIYKNQMDVTLADAEFMNESTVSGGILKNDHIAFNALVMPAVSCIPLSVLEKAVEFEKSGGLVIWLGCLPQMGVRAEENEKVRSISAGLKLSENPVAALKNKAGSGLKISADDLENIWVSNYKKDGKGVYFVVNTSPEANKIDLSGNGGFSVIINQTGDIIRSAEKTQFGMDGYTSLIVVSQ